MKIGFFSDAHGNIDSCRRCVTLIRELNVDEFYFLGDAIGYMPDGIQVLEFLIREKIPCLMGNHEAMALGRLPLPADRDRIYRLGPLLKKMPQSLFLLVNESWPEKRELSISGKKILLVHGRPADPFRGYLYYEHEPFPGELAGFEVVVMGHTHRPYIRSSGDTLLVNVGSCGLPRDVGNKPSFAIYDGTTGKAEIHLYEIDVDATLRSWESGSVHESVLQCLHRTEDRGVIS